MTANRIGANFSGWLITGNGSPGLTVGGLRVST